MKRLPAAVCGAVAGTFLAIAGAVCAEETVYKIVDEQGRVTYSTTPPAGAGKVERLELQPPPTEEQTKEAQELVQRLEAAADKAEKERREREQAELAAKAQQPTGIYITPTPVLTDVLAPYAYPNYGRDFWFHPPPYRPPGNRPDRPSRPGGTPRPKPAPRG